MIRSTLKSKYSALPSRARIALLTLLLLSPLGFPWQFVLIRIYAECGSSTGLASRCELGFLSTYFYSIEGLFLISCFFLICLVWIALTGGLFLWLGVEAIRAVRALIKKA